MARITVEDCLKKVDNQYDLVLLAKEKNLKVITFPIHEYWLDVGKPETLAKAGKDWPIN